MDRQDLGNENEKLRTVVQTTMTENAKEKSDNQTAHEDQQDFFVVATPWM
jgi:hypothetical protein